MRFTQLLLFALSILAACATQVQEPAQREQQAQTLRENTARLRLVQLGSTKADVQSLMGVASNRLIYREGADDVELWMYPSEQGWGDLKFTNGKVVEQKTRRTQFTFTRDTYSPLTEEDMNVHHSLAAVKIGWRKADVERLALKASTKLTETQWADALQKGRALLATMKDSPLLIGVDLGLVDVPGEVWMFQAPRLSAALWFREGQVVRIAFGEQPTKAQQNEMLQRAF